jgi:OOP family OmpA-OmpF porin
VTYLVDRGGIARSRLKSVGYGETRPIGDNNTETGKRMNRRINAVIACATDLEGIAPIPERITMAMELEFDRNSDVVKPQYREELRKVANFMKANAKVKATVEGHTGNLQASPKVAMEISQRRAQNVVNYLVTEFAVPRSRLAPKASARPGASPTTPASKGSRKTAGSTSSSTSRPLPPYSSR